MTVVLIDSTNRTWATVQEDDGYLHTGFTAQAGPRVEDLLEFAATRSKQFEKFIAKKREEEESARQKENLKRRVSI